MKPYTNISSILREGRDNWVVRNEDPDIPANQVEIPDNVPLYIKKENGKFIAFIEVNEQVATLDEADTRKELTNSLAFAFSYSMYSPSVWYREYRKLMGFTGKYQTPEQQEESANRSLKALAVMAGVNPKNLRQNMDKYIVMSAREKMPNFIGSTNYYHIAVVETTDGKRPKMISTRARGV